MDHYVKHVNAQGTASTAFIKALDLAGDHIAAHPKDNVLICISGITSCWFQNQVRGLKDVKEISQINGFRDQAARDWELKKWVATMQFFLFGDGVAAVLATGDKTGLTVDGISEVTNVDAMDYLAGYSRLSALDEPFKFGFQSHLDKEIPKLGVKYTDLALKKLLKEDAERTVGAVKKWAVHTGSGKILSVLADHHGIQEEKLRESHVILQENGNLAGASLPFILEKILEQNKFINDDLVMMVGYGWGFSASACLLRFS